MKELKIYDRGDGVFEEYDDTYDLTIHCTSQEEQDEWAEQGGDGQIHFLCPKWEKVEGEGKE